MPRLSIVIPCLGGAAQFDGTLVSVLQNRPADCEVLVVHTERYDDPYGLADEVQFVQVPSHRLVGLINTAIQRAAGEIIHIIGCGLEVVEDWTEPALAHFDDPQVAAVSPLILSNDGGSIVAAGVRWSLGGRRHVVGDRRLLSPGSGRLRARLHGPTLLAAYYRREVLAALDGLDPQCGDELADVDLALAIQSLGRLHVCEPASRLIQAIEPAASSGGFFAGRAAEQLFWRHACRRGLFTSLALHAFAVSADIARELPKLSALTSLVGRVAATLEIGAARRHQERIAVAAERLTELSELRATVRMPARQSQQQAAVTSADRRRAA